MSYTHNSFKLSIGAETRTATLRVKLCHEKPVKFPEAFGEPKYYKFRFEDFLKRHKTCAHEPPVYYFGPFKRKSNVPYIGGKVDSVKEWWSGVVNTEVLEPPYPTYKKGTPIIRESYGFKYCVVFSNALMPKLSEGGKKWLKTARVYLQEYMEQGVIDGKFISKYDEDFNKEVTVRTLDNVELDSGWFQRFAFATHPDAYLNAGMLTISFQDKFEVSLTPDFIEWTNSGTWYQAWLVGKQQLKQWKKDVGGYGGKKYKETKEYLEKRMREGEKKAQELLEEMKWY